MNTHRCIHCTLMRCNAEGQACWECLANSPTSAHVTLDIPKYILSDPATYGNGNGENGWWGSPGVPVK